MSLFNEHLYDYLAVIVIFGAIPMIGLLFAIGGILRRFKYFKWWPDHPQIIHPVIFYFIPVYILVVLIYFYMLELYWEPSYRMDSYDKQWDIFKEHLMYKGYFPWRNKPPPHYVGKTISERDKPAIDKAHRLSENLLKIQKLNLMIERQ